MSAVRGIAIRPDKSVGEVTIDGYKELSAIVRGYIEAVRLTDGSTMYVNEEFRLGQFGPEDRNSIAGDVCGLAGRPDLMLLGILGPVVILGPIDAAGYDTDVTDRMRRVVRRVAREA